MVYLVIGCTFKYEEWETWTVAAYTNKESAEEHVNLLNKLVNVYNETEYRSREGIINKIINTLDPNFHNLHEVYYEVEPNIPLVKHLDEYLGV